METRVLMPSLETNGLELGRSLPWASDKIGLEKIVVTERERFRHLPSESSRCSRLHRLIRRQVQAVACPGEAVELCVGSSGFKSRASESEPGLVLAPESCLGGYSGGCQGVKMGRSAAVAVASRRGMD